MEVTETADSLVVLTKERAARLAGVSARQVDYWQRTGLVRPTVEGRLTPQRPVRLYGYIELLALLVIVALRQRGHSLQHIRAVVGHLRSRGYDRPLTQLKFATQGAAVYFQHPDGTWEGEVRPDQIVMHEVIDLEVLDAMIREAASRRDDAVGQSERRRGALGSKEVVKGTRLPVETVRQWIRRGSTDAEIVDAFPVLELGDVAAIRRILSVA
jgi:DNA-binding transcriptional MerR regulator